MKISIFYNKSEIYNIFHIEVLLHSDLDSESDSALCPTEQSPTPRCAEQLLIFFNRKNMTYGQSALRFTGTAPSLTPRCVTKS